MAKSSLGKSHSYIADPLAANTSKAPTAGAAGKATKIPSNIGTTTEGRVQGKGSNKPR